MNTHKVLYCILLIFVIFGLTVAVSKTIDLQNIEKIANGKNFIIITFFSNNCPACKDVLNEFQKTSEHFKDHTDVVFSKVNIAQHQDLALKFKVSEAPVVIYLPYSRLPLTLNEVDHKEANMLRLIRGLRIVKKLKPHIQNTLDMQISHGLEDGIGRRGAKLIDSIELDKVLLEKTKHVLLALFTPDCQRPCTIFDKIAEIFNDEEHILIAKLDTSLEPRMAEKYTTSRNPTLIWFSQSDRTGRRYGSDVDLVEMVAFINDHTGSNRTPNGKLMEDAGRIMLIDSIVRKHIFEVLNGQNMNSIIHEITSESKNIPDDKQLVHYYIKLLEEIKDGQSIDYILEKQHDTILNYLKRMNLKIKERELFAKFLNIVKSIVELVDDAMQKQTEQSAFDQKRKDHEKIKAAIDALPKEIDVQFEESVRAEYQIWRDEL